MLSFFDGLGTAFMVCDNYCKEHNLHWLGASWEIDKDLESLGAEHFPQVTPRGDFEQEDAATIQKLVDELDPSGRARIVIAGGPPCHDFFQDPARRSWSRRTRGLEIHTLRQAHPVC